MAGLRGGALALLAFGGAVRASPFAVANGTITEPPTTTAGPTTRADPTEVTCGGFSDFPAVVLQEYTGYSTDPALQCQCLISVNNWLSTSNPPTRTLTRTIGTGVTTFTEVTGTTTEVVTTVVNTVETATVTENFILPQGNVWYGTAEPPCCYSCTIAASTVEVFYWPEATGTEALSTSFTSDGMVFESPSVYIGFSALSAYDYCGFVGQPRTLNSLTTPTYYTPVGSAALNTADLERNCSTISGYSYIPGNPSNAMNSSPDPCHPTIVIPDRIRSLDPAWKSCITDGFQGFYDPPSALSSVSVLVPTTAPPPPPTTTPASPLAAVWLCQLQLRRPLLLRRRLHLLHLLHHLHPLIPATLLLRSLHLAAKHPSSSSSTCKLISTWWRWQQPPPASSSNGAGNGSSSSAPPSGPSGTPGGGNGGGNNGGGNGGGNNGGGNNGGGNNGGGNNGGGNGGGSNGGGSNGGGSNGNNGSGGDGGNSSGGDGNNSGGNGSGGSNGGAGGSSSAANGVPPFTENSQSQIVIGSTTLSPGGPAITVGGTTLSLPTSGSSIVVNGNTVPLSETEPATPGETGSPGSQETSTPGSGGSPGGSPGGPGSSTTASAGLPTNSIPTVPQNAAPGLFPGAMTNIKAVAVLMLVAFYI
ncbi:hypothetical protein TrVFT333_004463 [Trichoderma virens FT-333]|nr:hypothetical protein TrVFT333_004463 [Trichoderma virens FT-333]